MQMPPDNVRGRPPVTSQESGPNAYSAIITTIRVTDAEVVSPEPGCWQVSDLPAGLAKRVTVDRESGCWRVAGYHDDDGYTYFAGEGAHRAAYRHLVGEIPEGRQIDHVRANGCLWRDCVNVNGHLEPVTPRVNVMRGSSFSALNAVKVACGTCSTPYDAANTYVRPDTGARACRNCNRAAVSRYKGRQRQTAELVRLGNAWDQLAALGRAA